MNMAFNVLIILAVVTIVWATQWFAYRTSRLDGLASANRLFPSEGKMRHSFVFKLR
jgi:hypothetical protein